MDIFYYPNVKFFNIVHRKFSGSQNRQNKQIKNNNKTEERIRTRERGQWHGDLISKPPEYIGS